MRNGAFASLPTGVNQNGSEAATSDTKALADAPPSLNRLGSTGQAPSPVASPPSLPKLQLPQGARKYSDCARELFKGMAGSEQYFVRDEVLLTCDEKGETKEVTASMLQSRVEKIFATFSLNKKGEEYPDLLTQTDAKTLLDTEELTKYSNPLRLIVQVPPLICEAGNLRLLSEPGYHPESGGLWVVQSVPGIRLDMPPDEAKDWLTNKLFTDYDFVTLGDLSRAVAQVISPALKIGSLLGDVDYPMDLGLANKSQSGKTHRMKFTAWVYGEKIESMAQSKGGVGSPDESIGALLHSGKPFLLLDNVRGDVDSQVLESVLRGTKRTRVRLPYSKAVSLDTTRSIIQLTSNDANPTKDLMNRSLIISNRKRAKGYKPVLPWGDDFFPYIECNRSQFLSAVYSVVAAWWAAGKPRTSETRHDFREWVQSLDWMVHDLLGLAPLIDGQTSVTAGWFREMVRCANAGTYETKELLNIVDANDIEVPGDNTTAIDLKGNRSRNLGRQLNKAVFRNADAVTVDGKTVTRTEEKDRATGNIKKLYTIP